MSDPVDLPQGATIPAKYSNYFTVIVAPDIVRLAFGEGFGSPESSVFHTALALTPGNAEALANTILQTIQRHRAEVAVAMQESKDGS